MKSSIHPACELCKGSCCEYILLPGFFAGTVPPDVRAWWKHHGEREGNDLLLPLKCKHLEHGKCAIYPDRPKVCQEFQVGSRLCRHAVQRQRSSMAKEIMQLYEH